MKKLQLTIIAAMAILLTVSAGAKAANTKLLLHFDGADGATTAIDSSPSGHTPINFWGTAQLDTAQGMWGSASLLLDGDSDYLTIADSPDWDLIGSSSDNWTIDFFVKHTDHSGQQSYIAQYESASESDAWFFGRNDGSGIFFAVATSGVQEIVLTGDDITDSDWHHLALCKVGSEYGLYKDGMQIGYASSAHTDTYSSALYIGSREFINYFDGWMDEIRITQANYFAASPNAGLADTVTVPVPEPATIALLGLGSLALLRKRRP